METENLSKFIDDVIEGAYQKGLFAKEAVSQVLMMGQMIKEKMVSADSFKNKNIELNCEIEKLKSENELLKKKFSVSDLDIETWKIENDINEIYVPENSIKDLSPHSENGSLKKKEIKEGEDVPY
jgi:hypothetical protein